MKIAYLGPKNTFTEKAANEMFDSGEFIPLQPIRRVINEVESGKVDYGVVPLENFYNGEVRETIDSLTECSSARIIKDKAFSIVHCIGALSDHIGINKIYSKDQALEQCSKYLLLTYPDATLIATPSTSEAVDFIVNNKLKDSAAIASLEALDSAKLKIIAKNICPNNKTRFVVIGREKTEPTGNDRTFLVFHPVTKDHAGTLHNEIGFFASFGVNLDYIQSRPDGLGGYFFYIELTGHEKDESVKRAIENLRYSLDPKNKYPGVVKVIGSYPNTDWKNGK